MATLFVLFAVLAGALDLVQGETVAFLFEKCYRRVLGSLVILPWVTAAFPGGSRGAGG